MSGLHKWRFLKPADSESDVEEVRPPDSNSSFSEAEAHFEKNIIGHHFQNEMDKKIWSNVVVAPKWFEKTKFKPIIKHSV